ncbi:MAG: alpha-E domain-containing protein [Planctomycetales bacterium]
MLSRVADSIFWMSRYLERAENVARFVDVKLNMALDLGPEMTDQWGPLVQTTGDYKPFIEKYKFASQENVVQFLTFDEENPNSVLSCLRGARENARTIREMISTPMWEELNKFYLMVMNAAQQPHNSIEATFEFFEKIKQAGYVLEGVTEATMSHGEAWHFRRLGRMLERADKTSRIVDVKYFLLLPNASDVGTPLDTLQWTSLLKSVSAFEMYRQIHGRITPTNVANFLILNRDFPRAIRFCVARAEQSMLTITGTAPGTFSNKAEQRLGRLRAGLDYANIDEIIAGGLHEFIDQLQTQLNVVGDAIRESFFETDHSPSQSQNQKQEIFVRHGSA